MSYYNNITKQSTIYPYRFKTEKEFKKEFGEEWYHEVKSGWVYYDDDPPTMNHFFGTDFKYSEDKEKILYKFKNNGLFNEFEYILLSESEGGFSISPDMLIENNIPFINYNKPKELVYEGLKYKEYEVICVSCKDIEESNSIQKYLFDKGYGWTLNGKKISNIYEQNILFKNNMKITRLTNSNVNRYLEVNYNSYLVINGLFELKKLFGPDYNTPRQLVYENKIVKFNKYKKGE